MSRYVCAENELVLLQWVMALRIVKNKGEILENYRSIMGRMETGMSLLAWKEQQRKMEVNRVTRLCAFCDQNLFRNH